MKKLIAITLLLALVLTMSAVYAAEPVTVGIVALDYQSRKVVTKTYVENEHFLLRVDIGIPKFADLSDMELRVEIDGVELDDTDINLVAGSYYITGIVTAQPAAIRIKIKDMAYDNAETAEELYEAMQRDRTVSKTYYFYTTSSVYKTGDTVIIPKTGDASVIAYAALAVAAAAACWPKRRTR